MNITIYLCGDKSKLQTNIGIREMPSPGLQLFEQQRTTIDLIHGSDVVGPRFQEKTDAELGKNPDIDQTHTIYYPPWTGQEVWDDKTGAIDLVKRLSIDMPGTNIAYARIVRMREEVGPITVFRDGVEYYILIADPLIIYSLGGSRFFPQPSRTDEGVYNANMLIEFYGFPAVMCHVDSRERTLDKELKCRLGSNGYDDNFLNMVGGEDMGYNRMVRRGDERFKYLCPGGAVGMDPEYKIPPRASEEMVSRIQELAKILLSALYSHFFGTLDNIDIMFRIFDVAVGLAARDIEFQICPGNLFNTLARIHRPFIQNMPDPQGRLPFSYPRRPLSYYLDSVEDAMRRWDELAVSFSPEKYQIFYDYVSSRPGNAKDDVLNLGSSTTLGQLVGRKDVLVGIRQEKSIEKLDGRLAIYYSPAIADKDEIKYLYYREYFRTPKMRYMLISYWNLGILNIDEHDVEFILLKELESKGYSEHEIVRIKTVYPGGIVYAGVPKRTLSSKSKILGDGTDLREAPYAMYIQLEDEQPLVPVRLKHRYVNINGVSFSDRDIALLYNTALVDFLLAQDEQHVELPQLDHRDLKLLKSLFSGRISLLWFYENASHYMYSLLSGKRTILDIFDLVFARQIILRGYRLGTPLREQLSELDYLTYASGKISRLDELISEARRVSDI